MAIELIFSLAFHGTKFNGWQSQGRAPVKTLEDVVSLALSKTLSLANKPNLTVVSRLDSGVHAQSFVVRTRLTSAVASDVESDSFLPRFSAQLPSEDVKLARWRTCLPSQILLRPAVHAKQYSYYLRVGPYQLCNAYPGINAVSHYVSAPLNLSAMALAAEALTGSHDFTGLTSGLERSERRSAKRVSSSSLTRPLASEGASESINAVSGAGGQLHGTGEDACSSDGSECDEADYDKNTGDQARLHTAGSSVSRKRRRHPAGERGHVRTIHLAQVTLLPLHEAAPHVLELGKGPPAKGCTVPPFQSSGAGAGPGTDFSALIKNGALVRLRFVGDGFLRHQCRYMAAAILAVGEGKKTTEHITSTLAGEVTHTSWMMLPGRGLWLEASLLRGSPFAADTVEDYSEEFWTEKLWCNNPDRAFPAEHSIPEEHYHPPW